MIHLKNILPELQRQRVAEKRKQKMASAGLCQPNRPKDCAPVFKSYMETSAEIIH